MTHFSTAWGRDIEQPASVPPVTVRGTVVVARYRDARSLIREAQSGLNGLRDAESPISSHGNMITENSIREQLNRILQSTIFIRSEKLSRFLAFIVAQLLDGKQDELKEYVIGCEVYGRRPPYHPTQDSIVRAEARRLRGKLKEYYETAGRDDSIYIFLRIGSYIPVVQSKKVLSGTGSGNRNNASSLPFSFIRAGILPFCDLSRTPVSSRCARALPHELAYRLRNIPGCSIVSPGLTACFDPQSHNLADIMSRTGLQIALEGSLKIQGARLWATVRILDCAGCQLWTRRVAVDVSGDDGTMVEESIAGELSEEIESLIGSLDREGTGRVYPLEESYPPALRKMPSAVGGCWGDVWKP